MPGAILEAGEGGEVSWVTFEVHSRRRAQLIDITDKVAEAVESSASQTASARSSFRIPPPA